MIDNYKNYDHFKIKKIEPKKCNNIKNKSFTSNKFFNKIRSESNKTNKIEHHLFKIKKTSSNDKSLDKKEIFKKRLKNPINAKSFNNLTINNDDVLLEMNIIKSKAKMIENNIKLLTKEYKDLESKNKGNILIIEKILDLYGDGVGDIIRDNEINDLNNKKQNLSNIQEEENIENEDNTERKLKNCNIKINEKNKKINILKKQIILLNKTINDNYSKLNEIKNKEKNKVYEKLLNSLNNKKHENEEINKRIKILNKEIFKNDTKIKYYYLKTKQYSIDSNKLKEQINYENTKTKENEKLIIYLKERKKALNDNQIILEKELENSENEKININKEENELKIKIEENEIYLEEKEKTKNLNLILDNIRNELEKEINKIIVKKNILKKNNIQYSGSLNENQKEKQQLLEKTKNIEKKREKIQNLEEIIKAIKEKINKTNEEDKNIFKKNINDMINLNKKYKKQINNYLEDKKGLSEEINKYDINRKNKKEKLDKLVKEYQDIYNRIENDRNKNEELIINENKKIEEEKNFIEEIENLNNEINELKNNNEKLKKENKEIKITFDEKKKALENINKYKDKLNYAMEEMEEIHI